MLQVMRLSCPPTPLVCYNIAHPNTGVDWERGLDWMASYVGSMFRHFVDPLSFRYPLPKHSSTQRPRLSARDQHQELRLLGRSNTGSLMYGLSIECDKSDWLTMRNEYSAHAQTKRSAASGNETTSSPGVPFVMRWKNRDPWPIGFQGQFLLAVAKLKNKSTTTGS